MKITSWEAHIKSDEYEHCRIHLKLKFVKEHNLQIGSLCHFIVRTSTTSGVKWANSVYPGAVDEEAERPTGTSVTRGSHSSFQAQDAEDRGSEPSVQLQAREVHAVESRTVQSDCGGALESRERSFPMQDTGDRGSETSAEAQAELGDVPVSHPIGVREMGESPSSSSNTFVGASELQDGVEPLWPDLEMLVRDLSSLHEKKK